VCIDKPFEAFVSGESIAVDGACLTVVEPGGDRFVVDVSPETVERTTLDGRRPGERVNLERALRPMDRLGGHIVTGHVDCVGRVVSKREVGDFVEMFFEMDTGYARYVVEKGSVAVDGISLTVASIEGGRFSVSLVPATLSATTLIEHRPGNRVNIETDILGKYVEKLLRRDGKERPASDDRLSSLLDDGGFL